MRADVRFTDGEIACCEDVDHDTLNVWCSVQMLDYIDEGGRRTVAPFSAIQRIVLHP